MASSGKGAFEFTAEDRREEQGAAMAWGQFLLEYRKRENEQRTAAAQLGETTGSSHDVALELGQSKISGQ